MELASNYGPKMWVKNLIFIEGLTRKIET